ncbi:MAG: response regulator, partial [Actinomycetospora chiangmaiensis]|nr:response regulator [Actinomycetospora chiangmaiensis]
MTLSSVTAQDRILVVEDDEDSLYTLVTQLSLAGYEAVRVARDGEGAIAALEEAPVDLVLLDLMMPGVDGFSVLDWMRAREDRADVPVIVISALDTPEAIVRSVKLGAVDFLPKPVAADPLRARVRASLGRGQSSRAAQVLRAHAPAPAAGMDSALLQGTLESLSVAAFIVGARGRVLAANGLAAALAADGLRQVEGVLRAADPDGQRDLLALIDAILQGPATSKAIALSRPSRRMPLLVRGQAAGCAIPEAASSCVLLLVADPESGTTPQVTEELTLLGLTRGESRLAALVGCGHSPREAAAKLGITEET